MMEERTVLEKIASAVVGPNGGNILGALGMAQIEDDDLPRDLVRAMGGAATKADTRGTINAIGSHLTRLQAIGNQLTYDQARESIAGLVGRLNKTRSWRLSKKRVNQVAESALLMHLKPSCQVCNGRKYEPVPGSPLTSGRACRGCHGTGKRAYPTVYREEVTHTLNVIGLIQGLTERAVARRLG